MELNHSISTPLYKQLEDIIQAELESGLMEKGQKIPTEAEFSAQYGVSRVTVRKALEALSKGGYLERKSGKGTFVAERKLRRVPSGAISFSDMCRLQGKKSGAKTIRLEIADPTPEECAQLSLAPGEKIIVLERIRTADDVPVALELTKFPESPFFFLFHVDLGSASLYDVIREKCGAVFTNSMKTLEIVYADYKESRYLGVAKGHPLLSVTSVVSDSSGQHPHLARQLSVADKFKPIV